MTTDIALLVNPVAGDGRGFRAGRLAAETLRARGNRVREIVGLDPDDVAERTDAVLADGADSVVVVGGDGMVHLAIQRLAGTDVPMGVVPAGAGAGRRGRARP
ncbi:MAG: diacylglycerol kinase family protein, partial [Nocardioidaceae bacterium]